MGIQVILPKSLVAWDDSLPLFFLAGPVRGGGDWQQKMCRELQKRLTDFYVAIPCRYTDSHPLWHSRAPGSENFFNRQLEWERNYLECAGEDTGIGCVIFWLACESKTAPHPGPEPYAMDTRRELGEWCGRMFYNESVRVVIGAEKEFLGLSQIQRCYDEVSGDKFPIYPTMEATVEAAVKRAGVPAHLLAA